MTPTAPARKAAEKYSVAPTLHEGRRALGQVAKVEQADSKLPICYCDEFPTAERIADALNAQERRVLETVAALRKRGIEI